MTNIYNSEAGQSPYSVRAAASSVVSLDAIDRALANRIDDRLLAGAASLSDQGPLRIDTDYDELRGTLQVTLAGSLAAMKLLDYQYEEERRLFELGAAASAVVRIDPMQRHAAMTITNYLLASAKNHPRNDVPLRIDTPYDEASRQLELHFHGSVFAVSHLVALVYVLLTQSRTLGVSNG